MDSAQTAQTAQSFVKRLKAPSDPPEPNGPSKFDIGRNAWDNKSFYIPNKGEVIADWLLTRLLKDKAKEPSSNPLLDTRYWTLLADVISPSETTQQNTKSRPSKTWLTPLLNRIPTAPIIHTFISLLPAQDTSDRLPLTTAVRRCLAIMWPLSVHQITLDALLDCFGGVLKLVTNVGAAAIDEDESSSMISDMITTSFRSAFGNASNKKKAYQTFTQTHLHDWFECIRHISLQNISSLSAKLCLNIYATGVDILFNFDLLRQTQTTSTSALPTILTGLLQTHPTIVFPSISRLFDSYIQSVRKNRGALFNQSSGGAAREIRGAALVFFVSSMALLDQVGDGNSNLDLVWETKAKLLEIVDREMLFVTDDQKEAEEVLQRAGNDAIEMLGSSQDDRSTGRLAIMVLATLTRVDFDLIAPTIPLIIPKLLLVPVTKEACSLIDLFLDYHTKTRTMHTYISTLLSSLSLPLSSSRKTYILSFSSPLLDLAHLDRLAKCTHNFLTPGQTQDVVFGILQALEEAWDAFWEALQRFIAEGGEASRKKRKMRSGGTTPGTESDDCEALAVKFTLTARLSSTVLSSLPLQSLPESSRQEVNQILADSHGTFIRPRLKQLFEMVRNSRDREGELWTCQVAAAALLRLEYTLAAAQQLKLQAERDDRECEQMLEIVRDGGMLPELGLEIFRSLLSHSVDTNAEPAISQKVLQSLLHFLERYSAEANWSGLSCHLAFGGSGQKEAALALLHLLIDRWLPAIDLIASRQDLERIARMMIAINLDGFSTLSSSGGVRPSSIMYRALRSAQFWELIHMRAALLSTVNDETSPLDKIDTTNLQPSRRSTKGPIVDETQLRRAISAYELLLFVPTEYLPRTSRQDLIRRATIADFAAYQLSHGDSDSQAHIVHSTTILRVFLKRWFSYQSSANHKATQGFVEHLMDSSQIISEPTTQLTSVTLDLIEVHLSALLRSPEKTATKAVLDIISSFSAMPLLEGSETKVLGHHIKPLSLMRLLEVVTRDFSTSAYVFHIILRTLWC